MPTQIQVRRDAAATWTSVNPTLASGEIGFETDTGKVKVGDGTTAWASLAYLAGEGGGLTDGDYGDVVVSSSGTVLSVERVLHSNGSNSAVTNSVVLGSNGGTAGGSYSSVIGGQNSSASGSLSTILASNASTASTTYAGVVCSDECTAGSQTSVVMASTLCSTAGAAGSSGQVILGSFQSEIPTGVYSAAVIGSDNTINPVSNSVAMGFDPAFGASAGAQYRTVHLMGETGDAHLAGGLYFGVDTWGTNIPTGGAGLTYDGTDASIATASGSFKVLANGDVDASGKSLRIRVNDTPATATAVGNKGEIRWDANYIYVAVDANTWKRAALTSW